MHFLCVQSVIKYYPEFRVSINLSYVQILKSPLMMELKQIIEHSGISCNGIIVELTEVYLEGISGSAQCME